MFLINLTYIVSEAKGIHTHLHKDIEWKGTEVIYSTPFRSTTAETAMTDSGKLVKRTHEINEGQKKEATPPGKSGKKDEKQKKKNKKDENKKETGKKPSTHKEAIDNQHPINKKKKHAINTVSSESISCKDTTEVEETSELVYEYSKYRSFLDIDNEEESETTTNPPQEGRELTLNDTDNIKTSLMAQGAMGGTGQGLIDAINMQFIEMNKINEDTQKYFQASHPNHRNRNYQ